MKEKIYKEAFARIEKVALVLKEKHPEYKTQIDYMISHNLNVIEIKVGRQRVNFGKCAYERSGRCVDWKPIYNSRISYHKALLEKGNENKFLNTVCHEIVHSVATNLDPKCGHRGVWKEMAIIYNQLFPNDLKLERLGSWDDIPIKPEIIKNPQIENFKYIVECEDCDFHKFYKRRGKVIKNINNYFCPHCKAPLYVKELG